MKKLLVVFLVFFIGTSCVVLLDRLCYENTGKGGELGLSVKRVDNTTLKLSLLGFEGHINL